MPTDKNRNRRLLLGMFLISLIGVGILFRFSNGGESLPHSGEAKRSQDGIQLLGSGVPNSGVPKIRRIFIGDPKLVEDFLDSEGRSAANLIAAFTLVDDQSLRINYLKEAYAKYPGHPLVVGYAMVADGITPNMEHSAGLMIKHHPDDASGYLLGALARMQSEPDVDTVFSQYMDPLLSSQLETADYLRDVVKARFSYARNFELMTETRAIEVAILSGGIVRSPISDALRLKSRELGDLAAESNSVELAQKWYLVGLIGIQAEKRSGLPAQNQLHAHYEKDFVNRLADESIETYLGSTRLEIENDIKLSIDAARKDQQDYDSAASKLSGSQYREFLEVLVDGGQESALNWMRSLDLDER